MLSKTRESLSLKLAPRPMIAVWSIGPSGLAGSGTRISGTGTKTGTRTFNFGRSGASRRLAPLVVDICRSQVLKDEFLKQCQTLTVTPSMLQEIFKLTNSYMNIHDELLIKSLQWFFAALDWLRDTRWMW